MITKKIADTINYAYNNRFNDCDGRHILLHCITPISELYLQMSLLISPLRLGILHKIQK